MLTQYLQAALDRARYEIIEDEEPFYGEVPELPGVWATGKTLEECRRNLASALEDVENRIQVLNTEAVNAHQARVDGSLRYSHGAG